MRNADPIVGGLAPPALEWTWEDRFAGRFVPLAHPGTLLFAALLAGAVLQGVSPLQLRRPLAIAARRLMPVSVALLAMLFLSRLMVHSGMIDAIRAAAVAGLGGAWPLVAPAVGALGSFVTGSATASNVLFTTLQAQTAQSLGLPVAALLAAQGFGAAIGNIVCPHNIVAGAATVGLAGREPEILRRTLLPCAAALAVGGLALWIALAWAA
jgi:lactate permease